MIFIGRYMRVCCDLPCALSYSDRPWEVALGRIFTMAAINYQYDRPTFSDADLAKYPYLAELSERCPCDKIRLWNYKSGHPINEHVKTCVAWLRRCQSTRVASGCC